MYMWLYNNTRDVCINDICDDKDVLESWPYVPTGSPHTYITNYHNKNERRVRKKSLTSEKLLKGIQLFI